MHCRVTARPRDEGAGDRSQRVWENGREARAGAAGQASHLGEDVGRVGSGSGQRGEEGGLACRLDGVDHPHLGVFQVGGLAVGVDEHKDIIHTCRRETRPGAAQLRSRIRVPEARCRTVWPLSSDLRRPI